MRECFSIRYQAGYFTIIVALILITPLCGLLFNCGCTWPWAGLESHCNIHDPGVVNQCPWCVSTIAGAASVGLAVLMGFLLSIKQSNSGYDMRGSALAGMHKKMGPFSFIKKVIVGLIWFAVTAVITGFLSGYLQGYPYFLLADL